MFVEVVGRKDSFQLFLLAAHGHVLGIPQPAEPLATLTMKGGANGYLRKEDREGGLLLKLLPSHLMGTTTNAAAVVAILLESIHKVY